MREILFGEVVVFLRDYFFFLVYIYVVRVIEGFIKDVILFYSLEKVKMCDNVLILLFCGYIKSYIENYSVFIMDIMLIIRFLNFYFLF